MEICPPLLAADIRNHTCPGPESKTEPASKQNPTPAAPTISLYEIPSLWLHLICGFPSTRTFVCISFILLYVKCRRPTTIQILSNPDFLAVSVNFHILVVILWYPSHLFSIFFYIIYDYVLDVRLSPFLPRFSHCHLHLLSPSPFLDCRQMVPSIFLDQPLWTEACAWQKHDNSKNVSRRFYSYRLLSGALRRA